jgi:Protein of unknown function (DUF2924)
MIFLHSHGVSTSRSVRIFKAYGADATIVDGGYEHQGKRYRSLSAVARAITGTQWSGPPFFGLRKTGDGA